MNMSISDALNYPFRNNNMLKILPIAITFSIIFYIFNVAMLELNTLFICGGLVALLAFSTFIGGYYISALRRLQAHDENLPDFDIGQNIKDGFIVGIAGIVYMLPVIILAFIGIALGGGMSAISGDGNGVGGGILLMCGAILGAIVLGFILSAAMEIGIVRYAANESGGLFDYGGNWNLATSNFGTVLGLWGRAFVIGIIGAIVNGVLNAILGVMFPNYSSASFEPTTTFWLVQAVFNIVAYTITVFLALAQYHLMYRFGLQLGIGTPEKAKNEAFEF